MTITVNYEKRKNQGLFQSLHNIGFTSTQNYVPLYRKFFVLNENNYSTVNLNHTHYVDNIQKSVSENVHMCAIKSSIAKPRTEKVFFKFAPLLDPLKYMIGKYPLDDKITTLPSINSTTDSCHSKLMDPNNSSYVDGFFSYLSNQLMTSRKFVHGVRYYGSFLAIKKNFKFNVYDDLEYVIKSDFFNKNKNKLFNIDNYSDLFDDESSRRDLPVITIHRQDNGVVDLNVDSLEETDFGDVFVDDASDNRISGEDIESIILPLTIENIDEHDDASMEAKEGVLTPNFKKDQDSGSSKRSHKHTNSSSEEENSELSYTDDEDDNKDCDGEDRDSDDESSDDDSYDSTESDEVVNAYFPEFPVQVICMEACIDTLDQLILDDKMNENLWMSALMQIIMTLVAYQKVFSFTHNDLHTNNVMYVSTKKKYLYYCVKGVYYRVPTYGKIFKIIDFGRAIYKYDGKTMCSDSFGPSGDAASQYNIEPYYNSKKPRLDPNYSFDLCRLACSIFDYLVEDMKDVKDLTKCDAITRIIVEWCIDDNGINVLYKNNGMDRYPDFKLYKMIARCVHKHTPQAQLARPEFRSFEFTKDWIPNSEPVMNIDEL